MSFVEGRNSALLYDSHICRLCAEENSNGYSLFSGEENEAVLSELINSYLPLKITDDGKYPRWICPGCHLQVESTVQFFNLMIAGQETLRKLYKKQTDDSPEAINATETIEPSCTENIGEDAPKSIEDRNFDAVLLQKLSGNSQTPKKPLRKKRGRPPKLSVPPLVVEQKPDSDDDEKTCAEIQALSRRSRQIKAPTRYQESVKGNELEKIYAESGVIDLNEVELSDLDESTINEICCTDADHLTGCSVEVIGHVQDNGGSNLGDLVVIDNKRKKKKKKKSRKTTRFVCDVCNLCFYYEHKFLLHRTSHQNVRYECTECLKVFSERKVFIKHQLKSKHQGEGIIEGYVATSYSDKTITETEIRAVDDEELIKTDIADIFTETSDGNKRNRDNIDDAIEYSSDEIDNEANKLSDKTPAAKSSLLNVRDLPHLTAASENLATVNVSNVAKDQNPPSDRNDSNNTIGIYKCLQCIRTFNSLQSYDRHRETIHNEGRRFICSKCKKSFKNKMLLQRHQLVHSTDRPFICLNCNASFKTKSHLFYHEKSHSGEKKFECPTCHQFFAQKNNLTLHLRSHNGIKPHKCSVCEKSFTQHGNMLEHMRIHTGECPFECQICHRRFKTSSQVRNHTKRHEVIKPYKCDYCEMTFVQVAEVRKHHQRHKNIKPYNCKECDKSFLDNSALRLHMRYHTGERPFACTLCPRRFADRSNHTKHLRVHEKDKMREFGAALQATNKDKKKSDRTVRKKQSDKTVKKNKQNFDLSNSSIEAGTGDNSVWDMMDEDSTCIDDPPADNTTPTSATTTLIDGMVSTTNEQLIDVTYQGLDIPINSQITYYVVQDTDAQTSELNTNTVDTLAVTKSCSDTELLQTSNLFLTNSDHGNIINLDENTNIQTVILNLENPMELQIDEQTCCELLRTDETQNPIRLITTSDTQEILNYTSTLDIAPN